jgi:hypothetical protein
MFELDYVSLSRHGDFDETTVYIAEPYCIACRKYVEVTCDTSADATYIEDNCTFCKLCQMYIWRTNEPVVSGQKYNTSGGSQTANIVREPQQTASDPPTPSAPSSNSFYTSAAEAKLGCIVIDSCEEYADDKYDAMEDVLFAKMPSTRFKSASKRRRSRTPL